MTEKKQSRSEVAALPTWARWCAAVLGLLLIGLAALLLTWCFPTAYEWKGDGTLVKSTRAVSDLSGIVTALVLAGVGLLAFALNGVRLVKFGAGSIVAEGSPAVEYAKRRMENPPSDEDAREVDLPDEEDVEPTETPAAVLDGEMAVYELGDVTGQGDSRRAHPVASHCGKLARLPRGVPVRFAQARAGTAPLDLEVRGASRGSSVLRRAWQERGNGQAERGCRGLGPPPAERYPLPRTRP